MIRVTLTDTGKSREELDCPVSSVQNTRIFCDRPEMQISQYSITVYYGENLSEMIGTITRTQEDSLSQDHIIIIASVASGVFVIVIIIVVCIVRRYKSNADNKMKKYQDKMDNLEMTVARECKEGTFCMYVVVVGLVVSITKTVL